MKVLQINCVYKKGSTGKIVYDIHTELMNQGIKSVVCYGRGKKTYEENVYRTSNELYSKLNNLFSRFSGIMYGGCYLSTNKLIKIIKRENPNIVHLHCINGYFVNIYHLVEWLKEHRIQTVLTLHAEFMFTGGCSHALDCNQWSISKGCSYSNRCPRWRKETKSLFFNRTHSMWTRMKKAFDGFNDDLIVVSVSPWLLERAEKSPILENKIHQVVLNGLNTNVFKNYNVTGIRQKLQIKNKKVILHVTPYFSLDPFNIKGGYYVNKLATQMENLDVLFLVVGPHDNNIDIANNIILLGSISNQIELAQLYSMADVTLLTSKKETFSMVTAESLCCGTPVVGFKAGGPEAIAIKDYSNFVDYGDIKQLRKVLIKTLRTSVNADEVAKLAQKIYDKRTMCDNYVDIYKELSQKEKKELN